MIMHEDSNELYNSIVSGSSSNELKVYSVIRHQIIHFDIKSVHLDF